MSLTSLEPQPIREMMAAFGEEARPRPDCPDPDLIWQAAQGGPSPEAAREVVEHVAECPVCAESWDLTRELVGAAGIQAETRPDESEPVTRSRSWQLAIGIAALLCVALGLPYLNWPASQNRGGAEITNELETEILPRDACLLAWSGPPGAESYVLELSWSTPDDFGTLPEIPPMAALEGKGSYQISAADLAEVPEGARLEFKVTALRGNKLLDKKTFSVELK